MTKAYAKYGVLRIWIVDPEGCALEQYVLLDIQYELIEVFSEDEPVHSDR
jgi:Uma2 family endonuclease